MPLGINGQGTTRGTPTSNWEVGSKNAMVLTNVTRYTFNIDGRKSTNHRKEAIHEITRSDTKLLNVISCKFVEANRIS